MARHRVCMRVGNSFTHDARVRREAEALADAGLDVTVYADARPELPDVEHLGSITVRRIGKASRVPYWSIVKPLLAERADIYHAHDIDSLFPCLTAARLGRRGAKVVYDSHELWSGHAADKVHAKRRMLVRFEGPLLRATDALITASPAYTQVMAARYKYPGPAITVLNVPHFFTDKELRPAWAAREADDRIRVTAVGVFQKGRGAIPLIRSLAHLPEVIIIEFVGAIPQPDYEAAMREEAARFGDRVEFVGQIASEDVVPRMARARVSTALIEPLSESYRLTAPNKVFESMMAGTPLVASDMPTIAEFVRGTGCGIVCDVTDPASIARAIMTAIDGESSFRRRAREAACTYNWDAMKHELVDLYTELVS